MDRPSWNLVRHWGDGDRRRRALLSVALAVLVAGCGQSPSRLERLLASAGPERALAGRLYGETGHRPYVREIVTRGAAPAADLDRLIAVSYEIRRAAEESPDEESLADLGALQLLEGHHDRAIATFKATAGHSSQPRPANDLAVAYLARFETERRPVDLLLAVAASDAALARVPASPEALFNRALAVSKLGLRHVADTAWQRFQAAESDPAWRREAAKIATAPDRSRRVEAWETRRSELEKQLPIAAADPVERAVAEFPFHARTWAEEALLPGWARDARQGQMERAEARLRLAGAIGEALLRQRGEGLLHDAAGSVREVWDEGPDDARERLLNGLERFAEGLTAYYEQRTATAEPLLVDAADELTRSGNPLAGWARFYAAVCRYYDDADAGAAAFEDIATSIPPDRYGALAGRVEWLLGTIDKVQGRFQSSVGHTERAFELLDRSSGAAASAFVRVLLAESYSTLGEHEIGWSHRYLAFQDVPVVEGLQRNIAMWTEASMALRRQEALYLAGPLLDEAMLVAEDWGLPIGRATALLERAGHRAEVGDVDGALEDLEHAQAAVADMEPGGMRNQMHYFALVTEGLIRRRDEPARTVELLSEAFAGQVATGFDYDLITSLVVRASAYRRLGNDLSAEADFERAIDTYEGIRATVEDPFSRMRAFRVAQPAFESLIELRLDRDGDRAAAPAFLLSERARGRVLRDLVGARRAGHGDGAFVTLERLVDEVPGHVALVVYGWLPDGLVGWVVGDGSSRLVRLPVEPTALRGRVEAWREEVESGAPETVLREPAAELYDQLIRPLGLPPQATLVVVPDRFLSRLPWPALFDRRSERYLIAERPLSLAPSATLLLHALAEGDRRRGGPPSLLAVAVDEPVAYRGRRLPPLHDAVAEATAVARWYRPSRIFSGPEATRDRFESAAAGFAVLHFAGHALADPEVLARSVLLFHPREPSDSGALPLSTVLGLELDRTRLVVLSACQTLDVLADDREGVFGLGGAFLASGVPAVLAAQWNVDDRWASRLMPLFHQHYASGEEASVALREAVLTLMSATDDRPSATDWANFIVLGGVGH